MKPNPEKIAALKNLAPPRDLAGVRRFCGMVNYLGRYTPHISTILQPIRDLMRADADFVWDHKQQEAFDLCKQTLSSETVLKFYDMNKPTASDFVRVSCRTTMYSSIKSPLHHVFSHLQRKDGHKLKKC